MPFGEIPGFPPGSVFESRHALAASGVHRPLQAGICGRAAEGAESVVLSGGYVDDEDGGDVVLYTGAGGRDPKTGQQTAPQALSGPTMALATSARLGLPVRVVRGARAGGPLAPPEGYRYDGLYRVEAYWPEVGRDGYRVWRFRLEREPSAEGLSGLAEASEIASERAGEPAEAYAPAPHRLATASRVVRDTEVTRRVKGLHAFQCQVCGIRVETPAGPYAEAAHVRPLGRPHDGPDEAGNVLCLCPNHHVLFDRWAFAITDDFRLLGLEGWLRVHPRHRLGLVHLRYHRALYALAHQGSGEGRLAG